MRTRRLCRGRAREPAWYWRSVRTVRRASAPRRTPDRPADKCVAFLESEQERARQTQTPPVTVAIPCAPHHNCLSQQQQQKSGGREGGKEAGGGESSSASLGFCVEAAFGWRPQPRAFCTAAFSAQRREATGARLRDSVASWRVRAGTLASRGESRGALAPSPCVQAETTGSFICSPVLVADGGTLRSSAV